MLHYLTVPVTPFQQNASIVWCDATRQAAARIVALLLIADGHVSRSEMDALYGRDIERELGPRTCSKSF